MIKNKFSKWNLKDTVLYIVPSCNKCVLIKFTVEKINYLRHRWMENFSISCASLNVSRGEKDGIHNRRVIL